MLAVVLVLQLLFCCCGQAAAWNASAEVPLTAYGQGSLTVRDFQQGTASVVFETDESGMAVFTASSSGTCTFYALDAGGNETVQTVTIQVRTPDPMQYLPPLPGGGWGFARPGQHRFGW